MKALLKRRSNAGQSETQSTPTQRHRLRRVVLASVAAVTLTTTMSAHADDVVRVGLLLDMSGPFADIGKRMENAAKLYVEQNGDRVGGKRIELIVRDTGGPAPDLAKRLAQELVAREHVDFLAGFAFTPNALAAAPIATAAKIPMIVMGASTSSITAKSPYIARVSLTTAQVSMSMGQWAGKNKIRRVFTLVSDYGPGVDSEVYFQKGLAASGGEVTGSVRVPLNNSDFAPYLQRIKDARPDAVFVFLPTGDPMTGFMKGFAQRGLAKAGIKILGNAGWGDDDMLELVGDDAFGTYSTGVYSTSHASAANEAFLKAYGAKRPTANFMAVSAYDGMAVIYEVVRRLNGNVSGDKAMQVIKGLKIDSPRGPLQIDAETRDVIQTVYVNRVDRMNGKLRNVEFDRFDAVKDPGK